MVSIGILVPSRVLQTKSVEAFWSGPRNKFDPSYRRALDSLFLAYERAISVLSFFRVTWGTAGPMMSDCRCGSRDELLSEDFAHPAPAKGKVPGKKKAFTLGTGESRCSCLLEAK